MQINGSKSNGKTQATSARGGKKKPVWLIGSGEATRYPTNDRDITRSAADMQGGIREVEHVQQGRGAKREDQVSRDRQMHHHHTLDSSSRILNHTKPHPLSARCQGPQAKEQPGYLADHTHKPNK